MLVLKNIQFTRLIKVNGYLKEFNFRKSNQSLEGKVSVDTIDERGNRIMFQMERNEAGWQMPVQELPEWITVQEAHLNAAIQEELKG